MSYKQLLMGLFAMIGWTGLACGQHGVCNSVASECSSEVAPRVHRPFLAHFVRTLLTPLRPTRMPPQTITDPLPTKEDIARMVADGGYSPAEITAAKIKMDDSQAKARQAAVRYLASVDCHYYPEAEAGLIAALRADRNETVRYEAAVALGACRGTTRKIIEALNLAALGQETDGNPSESSERVRQAARESLNRALANGMTMYPFNPPQSMSMMPMMAMPTMPLMDWSDPYAVQPTTYFMPMYSIPAHPASEKERSVAETVSTRERIAPPAPAARSFIEWLQSYTSPQERYPSTGRRIDPRLRGLAPLGSETSLAIPASPR